MNSWPLYSAAPWCSRGAGCTARAGGSGCQRPSASEKAHTSVKEPYTSLRPPWMTMRLPPCMAATWPLRGSGAGPASVRGRLRGNAKWQLACSVWAGSPMAQRQLPPWEVLPPAALAAAHRLVRAAPPAPCPDCGSCSSVQLMPKWQEELPAGWAAPGGSGSRKAPTRSAKMSLEYHSSAPGAPFTPFWAAREGQLSPPRPAPPASPGPPHHRGTGPPSTHRSAAGRHPAAHQTAAPPAAHPHPAQAAHRHMHSEQGLPGCANRPASGHFCRLDGKVGNTAAPPQTRTCMQLLLASLP